MWRPLGRIPRKPIPESLPESPRGPPTIPEILRDPEQFQDIRLEGDFDPCLGVAKWETTTVKIEFEIAAGSAHWNSRESKRN